MTDLKKQNTQLRTEVQGLRNEMQASREVMQASREELQASREEARLQFANLTNAVMTLNNNQGSNNKVIEANPIHQRKNPIGSNKNNG